MIGIIVTGHGHFATGLCSACEIITGAHEKFIPCDFDDMSAFDSVRVKLEAAMKELADCEKVIIYCDLLSGTPFNQSLDMKLKSYNDKIEIVYGTNLPLLIESVVARDNEMDLEDILGIVDNVQYAIGVLKTETSDEEDDF